ncbi:MAG TPA: hypothetical protein VI669_15065, partial [Vicinamibacteria bacterium]
LPYAPIYILAAAGLVFAVRERSPLLVALPAAAVYYLTVAAADNWAGAVCNLGRYLMPIAPLAVAFVGLALLRVSGRRGAIAVALGLGAWTAVVALSLWRDPHAANDSAVLLSASTFADGHVYIPGLHLRRWSDAAPGLLARVIAWTLAAGGLTVFFLRASGGRGGTSAARATLGLAGFVLVTGLALEQWPSARARSAPAFAGEVPLDALSTAFVSGGVREGAEGLVVAGDLEILVRSPAPRSSVTALVGGAGSFQVPGQAPVWARPAGAWVDVPLEPVASLKDSAGRGESLSRGGLSVTGEVVLRFAEK